MTAPGPLRVSRLRAHPVVEAIRSHPLFAVLFAGGLILRVITFNAHRPALLYIDSLSYLANVGPLRTGVYPIGYPIFLRALTAFGDLRVIPLVQHAIGLALAAGIYVLLIRAGARRWIAAVAAAPVLLDAYQLHIEQNVLSETLFQATIFLGLVLLVDGAGRQRSLGRRLLTSSFCGLLLGLAVVVRVIGQVLAVPAFLHLLSEPRRSWGRRLAAAALFACLFAIPVHAYMSYQEAHTGDYTLTTVGGRMLYGRAAVIVDCDRIEIPAGQRDLCPREPLGERVKIDNYVWNAESPANNHEPPPGMTVDESLQDFAMRVIRQQPVDWVTGVLRDMAKNFWPTKAQFPGDVDVGRWHFKEVYPQYGNYRHMLTAYDAEAEISPTLASWLRRYQLSVGYTPGTVLGLALVAGLLAGIGAGRARHSPLRAACLVWSVAGGMIMLLPAAFEFSWRYMLPGLVTIPVAAGLGLTAFMDPTGKGGGTRRATAPAGGERVDDAALERFANSHPRLHAGPIAVVIAAYNEEQALGDVLRRIPPMIDGMSVTVILVDDGSTDATAAVAKQEAFVIEPGINRGQGAALRLGYRAARQMGAAYIATLDADGQYDPAELPTVLSPVLRDEADFVTGSRRLGREETTDGLRRLGVRFYAWVVSLLTRQHITDTSFGLRAMKAEVTTNIELRQPQYQSAELLIGALAHGYRVLEVPATMQERTAGSSKKGHNVLYGFRYGRVVIASWLRERARHRATPRLTHASDRGTPSGRAAHTSPGKGRR